MTSKKSKFYEKGLRFACQGSGRCCLSRDAYGYIYLTLKDRRRLAGHLGLSTLLFTRRYTAKEDGLFHLKLPGRRCPFLEDKRCRVYEARPEQCRTWPFWPENMNEKVWKEEVASYCPGVGTGKRYSRDEIEGILESQEEE